MENYYRELGLPDPGLHPEIWGHTEDLYLQALYAIVRKEHPICLVELGTYRGYSTQAMAEALKANLEERPTKRGPLLITVDLQEDATYTPPPELALFIDVLNGDTGDPAVRDRALGPVLVYGPRPIDLLFIDADHGYASVARDYECWAGFVKPGGLIAFHDIRDIEGTRTHWQEIQAMYPGQTAMLDGNEMGLLRVPEPALAAQYYLSPRPVDSAPEKP